MVGIAVVIVASLAARPKPTIDLGPIDLRPGAVKSATFTAGYKERYAIGLEMNQRTAKRLFPCMADPDAGKAACKGQGPIWPVALSLTLSANGEDVTKSIGMTGGSSGGEYGGQQTYTWLPVYADLRRGVKYRLVARSPADGSALSAARPRLVVEVYRPGFLEELAVEDLAAYFVGGILIIGASVWASAGWLSARRAIKAAA